MLEAMLPVAADIAKRAGATELTSAELSRYSRHLLLPEIGRSGQQQLRAARVLIVGLGGLGSPVSMYLAAAGVGTLGLVDLDRVDTTNLQRQILYRESDVGGAKVAAAASALRALNAGVKLELHEQGITLANVQEIVSGYDLVVDGTDNFATRYLVHDACVLGEKPYIYGSISRFSGQASVFYPPHGPCYRCLFPAPPTGAVPNCAEAGVLGVLPGQIGSVQATEALKLLLGIGTPLIGRLLTFDALMMKWSELRLPRDAACPLCGEAKVITSVEDTSSLSCAAHAAPANKVNLMRSNNSMDSRADRDDFDGPTLPVDISVDAFHELRQKGTPHTVLDVRGPEEIAVCKIAGSMAIPLEQLSTRLREVPRDQPLVVYCKVGGRSVRAVQLLQDHGFSHARGLSGGIMAWIDAYDSSLARY